MPQMFPMNWWFLSLLPFLMILINMVYTQFIISMKKINKESLEYKTLMMNWKW